MTRHWSWRDGVTRHGLEEANQVLAEKKDKLQKLAQQLQAGPKPDEVMKISKEMGDLAWEVKKDEETSWWGMSEEEAAQEGQAWSFFFFFFFFFIVTSPRIRHPAWRGPPYRAASMYNEVT